MHPLLRIPSRLQPPFPPGPTTHVGEWKVLRVVQHRGKVTHRSKLKFRVQWCPPNNGIVSPDTWIPWTQAKPLLETMKYIHTVPLLHYLLQFLPARDCNTALSAAHYPRPLLSASFHSTNSTTGSDGQPLRYNKLTGSKPTPVSSIDYSLPLKPCTSFTLLTSLRSVLHPTTTLKVPLRTAPTNACVVLTAVIARTIRATYQLTPLRSKLSWSCSTPPSPKK